MSEGRSAEVGHTFWFRPSGGDFYLIPDDVEVPVGELELRTLDGGKRRVAEAALAPFVADLDAVSEHLKGRVNEGLQKFVGELGEAWRRGVATGATTETASEAERADANTRKIQEAAAGIVSGLKELSEKLEQAVRDAAANEAKPASDDDARSENGERHAGEPHGAERG